MPTTMHWIEHLGTPKISDYDFYLDKVTAPDGSPVHSIFHFRALDKPQDIKNLLSLELTGAWFNEVREIPKSIVDAMRGRVGRFPARNLEEGDAGATWAGIIMDTNPPDTDHWFYKLFEEEQPIACLKCRAPNGEYALFPSYNPGGGLVPMSERKCPYCGVGPAGGFPLTSIYKQPSGMSAEAENLPYLPKDYYSNLAAGMDQEFVNVYVHGRYGYVRDGQPVYRNFDPTVHQAQTVLRAMTGYPLIIAFDNTGLNQACVVMQYLAKGVLLILHEWLVEGMGTRRFSREIVKPYLWANYPGWRLFITGDPAGIRRSDTDERNTFEEIFEAFGVQPYPARSNAWQARYNAVDGFLTKRIGKSDPALIISQECRMTYRGFMGEYKMKRMPVTGSGQERFQSKPEKNKIANVHDAIQYGAMFTEDMYDLMSRDSAPEPAGIDNPASWGAYT